MPRKIDWEAIVGLAFFAGCFLFVVMMLYFVARAGIMERRALAICLEHGYPSVRRASWDVFYCIKRVDGQDVVVPVSELVNVRP
jgi:hypothetical protein